jgi:hypothetical protein
MRESKMKRFETLSEPVLGLRCVIATRKNALQIVILAGLCLLPGNLKADPIPPGLEDVDWPPLGPIEFLPSLGVVIRTIETDKLIYQPGEAVQITQRMVNQGEWDQNVSFICEPALEFWVLSGGAVVTPGPRAHAARYWTKDLSPDEPFEMQWTWDQTDADGLLLPPGIYEIVGVTGGAMSANDPVVSVTIVPEPAAEALMGLVFGLLSLRRGKRGATNA